MTPGQRLTNLWHRVAGAAGIFLVFTSAVGVGAAGMYLADRNERMQLVDRFPTVRAEERAACTREFQAQIDGLTKLHEQDSAAFADLRSQMADTHDVVTYTLRYLGDRAKVTDARTGVLLKQAREAANAAAAAQQTTAQVEKKVTVAATKADEAASTAKAVDEKLDTATRPALPAKPWAGTYR